MRLTGETNARYTALHTPETIVLLGGVESHSTVARDGSILGDADGGGGDSGGWNDRVKAQRMRRWYGAASTTTRAMQIACLSTLDVETLPTMKGIDVVAASRDGECWDQTHAPVLRRA